MSSSVKVVNCGFNSHNTLIIIQSYFFWCKIASTSLQNQLTGTIKKLESSNMITDIIENDYSLYTSVFWQSFRFPFITFIWQFRLLTIAELKIKAPFVMFNTNKMSIIRVLASLREFKIFLTISGIQVWCH